MQNKLLLIVVIVFSFSCGNNSNQSASKEKKNTVKDLLTPAFDRMEQMFQNDNWLLTDGKDSSYLYCSRLGKAYIKTYHFKMAKGDSVNTFISSIQASGDTIWWRQPFNTTSFRLATFSADSLTFTDNAGVETYSFEKTDSNHIIIKYPDGSNKNLIKTSTLSAFLVRSKYDFLHGTKLAFSADK